MNYEGMVHALEEAHRLLKPDGGLIDIHPLPIPSIIKVRQGGRLVFSEPYPPQSIEDYRQADSAIELAIQRHLFVLERRGQFDFLTYASSASELNDFFATANAYDQSPKNEAVQARRANLLVRIDQMINAAGPGAEVVFHETARIASMKPIT